MSEELIKKIKDLQHHHDIKQLLKGLLHILSNDWIKGLTSLKRSQALINKFGDPKRGHDITEIIKALIKAIPKKYKNRYRKYFLSIIPLNDLLQELSQKVTKSDFWLLDKEICVTSLLARFEAVYAHIDNNVQTQLEDRLQTQKMLHMRKPLFLRADDGSFVGVEKKVQQLAASLDRNLRFIEYHLKRAPVANITGSPEAYKAGALQVSGELWNSIFYLVDKVSLFDWYATKISDNPHTLYYQPKNKTEHILKIVGNMRESQWLLQQFIDAEHTFRTIETSIAVDDLFAPRNENDFRAYIELVEICHDTRILDVGFRNGLKVKQYIKAWFTISELAAQHFNNNKQSLLETTNKVEVSNLLIISADDLIALLTDKGKLDQLSAQRSIDLLTYWNMDHDVFSSPLFPTDKGTYLILTAIFASGNPARSIFRLLSHENRDLSFKGISSEKKLGNLFTRMGFNCLVSYDFHNTHGKGDIDCIAYKDSAFIICESKNIIPNESLYDRYRTMELFAKKASNQANRGVRFVNLHLSQICEHLSVQIPNREEVRIYPFIITNLFGFTGLIINGVPVCDFSALGKFAADKYVYQIMRGKERINRMPVKQLYKGDVPTADELVNQLCNPFQVEYEKKRLKVDSITQAMTKDIVLKVFEVREDESAGGNFIID